MNKKVLFVFGTRPEAIKMAPLVKAFQAVSEFETKVCVTAQHREMLDQVLEFFGIIPDFDLDIMEPSQTLNSITAKILLEMKSVLDVFKPDLVFVHGDTTTTMAASIAAFYSGAKVGHIEAGLRTFNKHLPFPEETNRRITSVVADYHFAPTQTSKENLIRERIAEDTILITGNTVIDALLESVAKVQQITHPEIERLKELINPEQQVILITGHRRENHGAGFINICEALKEIALRNPEMLLVYPVHLNPNVQEPVNRILGGISNIKLIHPLSYPAFIWLMNRSKIIITDSGGVQEEAPSLGKPVLVMRDSTERPEAVLAGTVILVGTDKDKIIKETQDLIDNPSKMERMSQLHNPYGDGKACERIVEFIKTT
ncbi:non-hydrolyzing UDP-N-acetylglucosamine 2-epimerase [Flavobacterium sp. NKUCC04_CG]|uniref:non-hydrolyzing UDP-N-acetylglucosamine 2-epimerase n=1 Tax=Flavobacterium sp. NKUCC04_CG TaxID=2842121 RepID=UPI001C5B82AD|nr:UDP-N-acetylglucosamine 2-epimerase (non-hydrolyzing) [Flavobacterium sp. NKUCC04_CG]MBW3518875.1 UDP-N-acetylglucosamine 2-epimerase (non-hydrolyzing) [Flavobacterium sp. NKUCC04_CG]